MSINIEIHESRLLQDENSDNYYQWLRFYDEGNKRLSYLLLAASQEFVDNLNGKIDDVFQQESKRWKAKGDSVFVSKFHFVPFSTSNIGEENILDFLRKKAERF